jgi:hypothetical protein
MGIICDTPLRRIHNRCQHLKGVTWVAVKKMDGVQTEVSTNFFFKDRYVLFVTLFETDVAFNSGRNHIYQ